MPERFNSPSIQLLNEQRAAKRQPRAFPQEKRDGHGNHPGKKKAGRSDACESGVAPSSPHRHFPTVVFFYPDSVTPSIIISVFFINNGDISYSYHHFIVNFNLSI